MSIVVVNESLENTLNRFDGDVEVHNKDGQKLGYFVPAAVYERYLYAWAKTEFTDEGLEAARNDYRINGGMTTAQLLAHLHSLDSHGIEAE